MLFRVSGLLLSAVGVFLLAMVVFSSLVFVSVGFNFSTFGNLFPISFVAGIAFAVAGMTLSAHSEQSNGRFLRRPCLIAGSILLTLSIFFSLFEFLEGTRMGPIQFGSLIEPYEAYFSFLPLLQAGSFCLWGFTSGQHCPVYSKSHIMLWLSVQS